MNASSTPKSDDREIYSILQAVGLVFKNAIQKAYPDVPVASPIVTSATNVAASMGFDYQCSSALNILQNLKSKGKINILFFIEFNYLL